MISRGTSGKLYDTFSITIKSLIEFLNLKNNLTKIIIFTMRIKWNHNHNYDTMTVTQQWQDADTGSTIAKFK
jgi:hypothetical protein